MKITLLVRRRTRLTRIFSTVDGRNDVVNWTHVMFCIHHHFNRNYTHTYIQTHTHRHRNLSVHRSTWWVCNDNTRSYKHYTDNACLWERYSHMIWCQHDGFEQQRPTADISTMGHHIWVLHGEQAWLSVLSHDQTLKFRKISSIRGLTTDFS